jgi:predicted dehydrogenase
MAIIGLGWAGMRHVKAIRELGRKITVTCLVDNDLDNLREKAIELGVEKTYTDFHDALADPDVDAVSICAPHNLHCPIAIEAAVAKKHILCEKPIATTVADATRMIDAAETNDMKLYVAENVSYTPMSKFLRELVRDGTQIGEVTFATVTNGFRAPQFGYPGRREWLTTLELGGTGTWMLHGIHSMAQMRFILGEVETVYMGEHKTDSFQRRDLEGTMSGLLRLENGFHVSMVQTCETRLPPNSYKYAIYADAGTVLASQEGCEVFSYVDNGGREPKRFNYPKETLSDYAQEMEAFADYVAGISVGPTTASSERRSLAIVQAGYESAQSGQPINLKERFGDI